MKKGIKVSKIAFLNSFCRMQLFCPFSTVHYMVSVVTTQVKDRDFRQVTMFRYQQPDVLHFLSAQFATSHTVHICSVARAGSVIRPFIHSV